MLSNLSIFSCLTGCQPISWQWNHSWEVMIGVCWGRMIARSIFTLEKIIICPVIWNYNSKWVTGMKMLQRAHDFTEGLGFSPVQQVWQLRRFPRHFSGGWVDASFASSVINFPALELHVHAIEKSLICIIWCYSVMRHTFNEAIIFGISLMHFTEQVSFSGCLNVWL